MLDNINHKQLILNKILTNSFEIILENLIRNNPEHKIEKEIIVIFNFSIFSKLGKEIDGTSATTKLK